MEVSDNLTSEEAKNLVISLSNSDHTVDVFANKDGTFRISWVKNKKYISYDGKEFTDEVWTTEDYRMICIQDLTEDHAKNIIRMMMRRDRKVAEMADRIIESITEFTEETKSEETIPTLH